MGEWTDHEEPERWTAIGQFHKELSNCAYEDLGSHGSVRLPISSPGCRAVSVRHAEKVTCVKTQGQTLGAELSAASFSVRFEHETVHQPVDCCFELFWSPTIPPSSCMTSSGTQFPYGIEPQVRHAVLASLTLVP